MEALKWVIKILAYAGLGFTFVEIYLTLNKLWMRKHDQAVTESISIMAKCVGLVPLSLFALDNLCSGQWRGFIDYMMWILATVVEMLIAAGLWVAASRNMGLWRLFKRALRLESTEVGDLAKSFLRPSGAAKIIEILGRMALIDSDLDEREKKLIQSFADTWGIEVDWDALQTDSAASGTGRFVNLRKAMKDYLDTSPPGDQITQLSDVLTAIVHADCRVAPEEEIILAELQGLMSQHVGKEGAQSTYHVAVVPQNVEQQHAMESTLRDLVRRSVTGGVAYFAGPFYSHKFAAIIAEQHHSLNFFSVVVESHELETVAISGGLTAPGSPE